MTEKKSDNKISSDKRAEDILSLIRNKQKMATVMFEKAVQNQMMHLSQSDMHRIVADGFDYTRQPEPEDLI